MKTELAIANKILKNREKKYLSKVKASFIVHQSHLVSTARNKELTREKTSRELRRRQFFVGSLVKLWKYIPLNTLFHMPDYETRTKVTKASYLQHWLVVFLLFIKRKFETPFTTNTTYTWRQGGRRGGRVYSILAIF